ncbi:hypothetical protein [Moorena producens]|uniref:hypothetical protein n=1 Tax=Moorena producens TaxID=1155739 RepID=UPI003C76D8F2
MRRKGREGKRQEARGKRQEAVELASCQCHGYGRAGRMPTLLILKLAVELASCQFQYIFFNKIFQNML